MTNKTLSHVLRNLKLENCKWIRDDVFYTRKTVRQMCYNCDTGNYRTDYSKYEFLVIAENGVKKAIILNCDNVDLHWYVFKKYRKKHVLSSVLKSGVIKELWPQITAISCCYEWDDDIRNKYQMTKYLASLAGLQMKN